MLYSVLPFPKRAIFQIFSRGMAVEPVHKERMLTPKRMIIKKVIKESQEMSLFFFIIFPDPCILHTKSP